MEKPAQWCLVIILLITSLSISKSGISPVQVRYNRGIARVHVTYSAAFLSGFKDDSGLPTATFLKCLDFVSPISS
jgi:hypothetical protein